MNSKYDISKKTDNSVIWIEAVEDIVTAKKRLISLCRANTSFGTRRVNNLLNPWMNALRVMEDEELKKRGAKSLLLGRIA